MRRQIIIVGDSNDGDYITSINEITLQEIEIINPIIEKIKNFKPYKSEKHNREHKNNYPWGEVSRPDLGEKSPEELYHTDEINKEQWMFWESLLPCGEYGIHTINSIVILEILNENKLL